MTTITPIRLPRVSSSRPRARQYVEQALPGDVLVVDALDVVFSSPSFNQGLMSAASSRGFKTVRVIGAPEDMCKDISQYEREHGDSPRVEFETK